MHHIDLDRKNNDIENLVAIPKELHQEYHKLINKVNYVPNILANGYGNKDLIENLKKLEIVLKNIDFYLCERDRFIGGF